MFSRCLLTFICTVLSSELLKNIKKVINYFMSFCFGIPSIINNELKKTN